MLNVIDLPHLLADRCLEKAQSIVRLVEPHGGLAFYIPAHLGLAELNVTERAVSNTLYAALGGRSDTLHWIDIDAIVAECARQAAS